MPEMPYPILDATDVMGFLAQAAKKWLRSSLALQEWRETLTTHNANPAMCPAHSMPHMPAVANSQPTSGCPQQPELLQLKAERGREKQCCYGGSPHLGNGERRAPMSLVSPQEPPLAVRTRDIPRPCAIHEYSELTLQMKLIRNQCKKLMTNGTRCVTMLRLPWWTAPHCCIHAQHPVQVPIVPPCVRTCSNTSLIS